MKFKVCGIGRDEDMNSIISNPRNSMIKEVYTLEQIIELSNGNKAIIILPKNFNRKNNTGILLMKEYAKDKNNVS